MNYLANQWTKKEIKILKENVGKIPTCKIRGILPERTLSSIYHKVRKLGLKADTSLSHIKYSFDSNFFKKPNLLNSYWAGFIAADGCILDYSNSIQITLKSSDGRHLKRFKEDVEFDGKLCYHDNHKNERTTISLSHANKLIKDLEDNFNIVPRKTLILKPPYLSLKNSLAYIIGYFDGDGTTTYCRPKYKGRRKKYLSIGLVGTYEVLEWIKNILDYLFEFKCKAHESNVCKVTNKNIYCYYIRGKRAERIHKCLRKINVPKLKRKWDVKYQ